MIGIISCINNRNSIGKNNDLLYVNREDMRNFVKITKQYGYVLMGMKTYESIPEIPTDRIIFVLSDQSQKMNSQCEISNVSFVNLEQMKYLTSQAMKGEIDLIVIGGDSVYSLVLQDQEIEVDKIYLTIVDDDLKGDSFFPFLDTEKYALVESRKFQNSKRREGGDKEYPTQYRVYQRKRVEL